MALTKRSDDPTKGVKEVDSAEVDPLEINPPGDDPTTLVPGDDPTTVVPGDDPPDELLG
jgi:hypothetical protein